MVATRVVTLDCDFNLLARCKLSLVYYELCLRRCLFKPKHTTNFIFDDKAWPCLRLLNWPANYYFDLRKQVHITTRLNQCFQLIFNITHR